MLKFQNVLGLLVRCATEKYLEMPTEGQATMKKDAKKIQWNTTNIQATRFGLNKLAACRVRVRYLLERADTYLKDGSDVCLEWAWDDLDEALYLLEHASYTQIEPSRGNRHNVTEEMKQQALNYPVTNLIQMTNGKGTAWCHNDKNPSLVWNKRDNKVWCPVCNQQYNPIDIIMHLEGLKYYDAIRWLCK